MTPTVSREPQASEGRAHVVTFGMILCGVLGGWLAGRAVEFTSMSWVRCGRGVGGSWDEHVVRFGGWELCRAEWEFSGGAGHWWLPSEWAFQVGVGAVVAAVVILPLAAAHAREMARGGAG